MRELSLLDLKERMKCKNHGITKQNEAINAIYEPLGIAPNFREGVDMSGSSGMSTLKHAPFPFFDLA